MVRIPDHAPLVLDAGTGIRAFGKTLEDERPRGPTAFVRAPEIVLLLSHRHHDHVMGLPYFSPMITRSHVVRIACWGVEATALAQTVTEQLSAPLFPTLSGVREAVRAIEFDAQDTLALGGDVKAFAFPAHHPGGAAIIRIDDAHGPLLAYAPDNELALSANDGALSVWRRALSTALAGTPFLLHDATYTDDEIAAHRGWGHSSAEEATRFAISSDIGTLVLMHHHPDRSDDAVDVLLDHCRSIVSAAGSSLRVLAATESTVYEVVTTTHASPTQTR